MKTLKLYIGIISFGILMTSCDPACDGTMMLTNNTDSTLTFIFKKDGFFETDTICYFLYQCNVHSKSTVYGDTLLVVECNLDKNQVLELFFEGPLGTLDLKDKESGSYYLGEMVDTIFLKDFLLKKDIQNMDNWNIKIDKYKNGGGESIFNFIVTNDDVGYQ